MPRTVSILLVEDLDCSAFIIAAKLRRIDGIEADVDVAGSVEAAKDKLPKKHFDLVVLDLGLPDSSGRYTFNQLRILSLQTPIIVLTANEDSETKSAIEEAGAFAYLIKGKITDQEFNNVVLTSLGMPMERITNTKEKECPFIPDVSDASATVEVGAPGGFFARVTGVERSSALMLVLVIVCFCVLWAQAESNAKSTEKRDAVTQQVISELTKAVTEGNRKFESAVRVQTYVMSRPESERKDFHLEMPEELRNGRYR